MFKVFVFGSMNSRSQSWLFPLFMFLLYFTCTSHLSIGSNTITAGKSLTGNQTILSEHGIFELGFFKPGNTSQNYYIGIWYKKISIQTVIWVANRDTPITDPYSSELKLLENGSLVLYNSSSQVWSAKPISNSRNPIVAVLLDNGNLALIDESNSSYVFWQSFDHPTDTWMPGAKLGFNKLTGEDIVLTSWRDSEDPAQGVIHLSLNTSERNPALVFAMNKNYLTSSNMEWNGHKISFPEKYSLSSYLQNDSINWGSYFPFGINTSLYTRVVLDSSGLLKKFTWAEDSKIWKTNFACPRFCGASTWNKPNVCECLIGFEPRQRDQNWGIWLGGCVRNDPLKLGGGTDPFFVMPNMELQADSKSSLAKNSQDCELTCLKSSNCTAYAYNTLYSLCLIWQLDLLHLEQPSLVESIGSNLHVRVALLGDGRESTHKTGRKILRFTLIAVLGIITILGAVLLIARRCRRRAFNGNSLFVFNYSDLQSATNNFAEKLGAGSFGSVYRGTLPNSIAIAVKKIERLTIGDKQFRAEVSTIGIIQHANIIHLRGFCAEGAKRFLIYDYMPNGSLNSYLCKDSPVLDWKTRYQIALGTARGLAYLHEKCVDCIIHCDIKPENILLDADFTPKLADFGLAKVFGRVFSRVLTTMRGTRGYLAPEWISGVAVTPKADVYSYGMMLFEIISGRRNLDIIGEDDMLDYFPAWVVNKTNKGEEILSLLDQRLNGNAEIEELTRACRIACWCIQDSEKDRPSMGHVVQVLEGIVEVDKPPIISFFQLIAENQTAHKMFCEFPSSESTDTGSSHPVRVQIQGVTSLKASP